MNPLVSGDWLAEHLDEVRVVDVRWYLGRPPGAGREAFAAGHLPGAVHLDIDTDLSSPASAADGRHPLPTPEAFAESLRRVGIPAGTPVVAYDDAGGAMAARLWWLLHVLGEPAAVLDGGLAAWPGALTTDVPEIEPVEREPKPWPSERFVTDDEVGRASAALFDARTSERFAGTDDGGGVDPRRGHIPGARSAPWQDNLGADGRFRDPSDLRERFGDGPVIAYCGSGVTACHNLLAMTLADKPDIALYPGSWSQWGADQSRPVETS